MSTGNNQFCSKSPDSCWCAVCLPDVAPVVLHTTVSDIAVLCVLTLGVPPLQVVQLFESFEVMDYARTGSKATEDFELAEGPVEGPTGPLPHTLETTLRSVHSPYCHTSQSTRFESRGRDYHTLGSNIRVHS